MDDPYQIVKETARRYRECASYSDVGRIVSHERGESGEQKTVSMSFKTSFRRPYDLRFDWQHDDIENQGLISWSGIQFLNARKGKSFKSDQMLANEQKFFEQYGGVKPDDKLVKAMATLWRWSRFNFSLARDKPEHMLQLASFSTYGASIVVLPLIFGGDRSFVKYSLNSLNHAELLYPLDVGGRQCFDLAVNCSYYPFALRYFISKDDFVIRRAIAYIEIDPDNLPQDRQFSVQALFEFEEVRRQ